MVASNTSRTGSETRLIGISKNYHKAIRAKDIDSLQRLFADKVHLYADGISIDKDIVGKSDVTAYWKEFFDKYDFQRTESVGAVNEEQSVAFSIVTDKATVPKSGNTKQPSNVISLTKLKSNVQGEIIEIYLVRQLRHDEAEAKFKKVPDYHGSSFNPEQLPVPSSQNITPSDETSAQHSHLASEWNRIFATNDVSKAEEISDANIKVHNLLTSDETTGLDAFKANLKSIFKDWECKRNDHVTAVSPGNKGFVFWQTIGDYKGESVTIWGITFLLFNEAGKISEAAAIYPPFPGQREALLK